MEKSASHQSEKTEGGRIAGAMPVPMRSKSFKDYYFGTILRPGRTFTALLADERRLRFGLYAILINVVLYTLVYVFLSAAGAAPSSFTPWLAIPEQVYYQYDRFILAPSMLMCWILAAGIAQLVSRAFSGKGSFEDMLSVFGFGISIACLASLLHDFTDSFLGAIGLLNLREYEVILNSPTIWRTILWILYTLSFILFLVLFPKGVAAAQRIRRGPAVLVGVLAFIAYQGMFLVFNR
jgi:hypothetical protein